MAETLRVAGALGHLYDNGGDGVAKDPQKAAVLYQKACSIGDQLSCDALKNARFQ
jgi:TPR repeat protein